MRLLLLTNKYPYPGRDGSSIAILNMIQGLLSQDIEVHLFALNATRVYVHPTQFSFDEPGQLYIKSMRVNTDFTLWSLVRNLFSGQSYHVERFYNRKFEEKLIDILTSRTFDVVQFEGLSMTVYLPTVRKYAPKSIVSLRAHNVEYKIWERWLAHNRSIISFFVKMQVKRLKKYEKAIAQQVDCILPISDVDRKEFVAMTKNPAKVQTVHFGLKVNNMRRFSNFQFGRKKIVHLASFDWLPNRQGIEWFLAEVWPKILKICPEAEFHVAGRNMPDKWLKNPSEKVSFHGEISSPIEFLLSGKILVVPLLSGSGVRIKLLEALALGMPVVSTVVGAEGIEVINGEHILLANDPQEFAHAVCLLLDDEAMRRQLSFNGRKLIEEHYDLTSIACSLHQYYKEFSDNRISY
ncbi:glycosyl transferase family 1 [Thermaurantimonas aggregans]|uniref:Glycosyl transferase family 1 n=1 Tax=Thermaurantimonas aggregans TaxID=2173829 RepID=A0A401XI47_9FLAO|nr:glycosyltransferase family 4 protein [Thermaurantimonas aggregans]MCX8149284.1 glycosyltransferase family 4 protein [Thermaurantimonas aggregans]GCD76682.1 glycosyl transferase family 1 [Thermaurantimonas aggregans]